MKQVMIRSQQPRVIAKAATLPAVEPWLMVASLMMTLITLSLSVGL